VLEFDMQGISRDPERVLVMMAHPDDPEFVAGGTIAAWRRQGAWVGYVVCTSGDKGSDDVSLPTETLQRMREEEQRRAARLFGIDVVEFLGREDGALQHTLDLRRDLVRAIRQHKPDTVVCFDPTERYLGDFYIQHSDHYSSGEAVLAAIYPAARNARTFPELLQEGLQPHTVQQVFMGGTNKPNRWIDISDTIDAKIAAMLEHSSQVKDPEGLAGFLRMMAQTAGATAQPAPLPLAEAFRFLDASGG
jgi:LmbE family N-acetylglucosaminyl deacetylase